MGQTLGFVLVHVVFSTKGRVAVLNDLQEDLHAYLATAVRNAGCECYRVGGMPDHVHLAIRLSRTIAIATLVGELKGSSSKWIKTQGIPKFEWQRGYGVFSVGPADLGALVNYIQNQATHHAKVDFQGEFRAFLKRYGIDCDERYVWE